MMMIMMISPRVTLQTEIHHLRRVDMMMMRMGGKGEEENG